MAGTAAAVFQRSVFGPLTGIAPIKVMVGSWTGSFQTCSDSPRSTISSATAHTGYRPWEININAIPSSRTSQVKNLTI